MHSLQIPLRVEARGDIALRSSFTHFSHREVPKQIQFCHTQSQRANWFRAQAAAFAKGERDVPRRHRS